MIGLPANLKPIVDPDLEAALGDLVHVARRIRQLNSILLAGERATITNGYQQLAQQIQERADRWGEIRVRAEKLNVPPRALMLMVEEADRIYRRRKRRCSLKDLLAAVRVVSEVYERDLEEADVDLIAARENAAEARRRATASSKAIIYLEACR